MRITVFGATGRIGTAVIDQALESGHTVTAVIRESARFDARHSTLEVVKVAGLTDARVLRSAVEGAEAVLSGVGPRGRKAGPVTSTSTRAIVQAMKDTGVRRYVGVSAAPVGAVPPGDSLLNRRLVYPFISWVLKDIYADLALTEDELSQSGIDWTVVRPPKLTNSPVTGFYRTARNANIRHGLSISRADVAHFMLGALNDPTTIHDAVGIAY